MMRCERNPNLSWITGWLTVSLLAMTLTPTSAQGLSVEAVGVYTLPSGDTGAHELSGLAWAGGDQYYAVSDAGGKLYPLTILIDPATGAVTSARLAPALQLAAGNDLEGIAYDASDDTVYVSAEDGPAIRKHSLVDGSVLATLTLPDAFVRVRPNRSLESLSLQASHQSMWTANEEALFGDGPVSTVGQGTTVRLQKFDASLRLAGQWAYRTDGISGDIPLTTEERSGVSDVLVLPNGRLLVLERELGMELVPFGPRLRARIYVVDFTGATDVSGIENLDNAIYAPVSKTLLFEHYSISDNFEGIVLGPALDDGSVSLLLISDDQGGSIGAQSLYALKLSGDIAVPGDANLDGKVDSADLALWQQNYDPTGQSPHTFMTADFNADGKVDSADLALWQQNYAPLGVMHPSNFRASEVSAVPEPCLTFILAAWFMGGAMMRRKMLKGEETQTSRSWHKVVSPPNPLDDSPFRDIT